MTYTTAYLRDASFNATGKPNGKSMKMHRESEATPGFAVCSPWIALIKPGRHVETGSSLLCRRCFPSSSTSAPPAD